MNPRESYQLYTALKLHFSTNYDYVKYRGKLKRVADFTKVNDKFVFARLAKHNDPQGLIISNLTHDPRMWARNLFEVHAQKNYRRWQRYREAIEYYFNEELNLLKRDSFKVSDGQHPDALRKYIKGDVSIDTLAIIDQFNDFVSHWNEPLEYDPIWSHVGAIIKKYQPFLQYDRSKIKEILKNWMLTLDI